MPELFLKVYEHFQKGEMEAARQIQNEIDHIIYKMCSAHGNLYAVQKAILAKDGRALRLGPQAHARPDRQRCGCSGRGPRYDRRRRG